MLKLVDICKSYEMGGNVIHALQNVSLEFRENEFVSILGPSGCGKTTTLNIIGGLDRYDSGDLIIRGKSTKEYKESDWDTYRNHSIGFVFQSYNLIPHQTALANVEIALTLAGVSKTERRRRAKEALKQVGLEDQMYKKPAQMSGGQVQRVAIARALINEPDILLADEPTGALDSETSIQVMALLKEVAKDRLVIMVTHNPDLAEQYSSRIIRLKDGRVVDDTNPYHSEETAEVLTGKRAKSEGKKASMSYGTALSLSMNNLRTKKRRTILTSFAGSIGIISIALILALSNGINDYIAQIEEETLSDYPITIEAESTDLLTMLNSLMGASFGLDAEEHDKDRIYSSTVMYDMLNSLSNMETTSNNLTAFKEYLDSGGGGIDDIATIQYDYNFAMDIYTQDSDGEIFKSDLMEMVETAMTAMYGVEYASYFSGSNALYSSMEVWQQLQQGEDGQLVSDQVVSQYELLYGSWPENYDEVVLFVDANNEISDMMLYALGLMPLNQMVESLTQAMEDETVTEEIQSFSYEELCALEFKMILPVEYYQYDENTGTYVDLSATDAGLDYLYNSSDVGVTLKVVGIVRGAEGTSIASGSIGYTYALTNYGIDVMMSSEIVQNQLADPATDVFSGLPFATEEDAEPTDQEIIDTVTEAVSAMTTEEKAAAYVAVMSNPTAEYLDEVVEQQMEGMTREDLVDVITGEYAEEIGVDASLMTNYIESMDDDRLFEQVEEVVRETAAQQYTAMVQMQLSGVDEEELAAMMDLALGLTDSSESLGLLLGESDSAGTQDLEQSDFAEGFELNLGESASAGDFELALGEASSEEDSESAVSVSGFEAEQYAYLYEHYTPATVSSSTYEENLDLLGYVNEDSPSSIIIYSSTFEDKDEIADLIAAYNAEVPEEDEIIYTDYVALLMSSITSIINGISYVLVAFVSISLIVSCIMIGIITNISVMERIKEIGILRAVGASRRDIARVFNAETLIVGLIAGLIGIVGSLLLTLPINALIHRLTNMDDLSASLPVTAGVILVVISVVLTIIAGLIPSRSASHKDPVEALRTE